MIKVDAKHKTVRECTAPYQYTEGGETKTDEIRVRYFSPTTLELKEERNRDLARAKDISEVADLAKLAAAAARKAEAAGKKAEKNPDNETLHAEAQKLSDEADRLAKESQDKAKAVSEGREYPWLSHKLTKWLESLPDLSDDKGKPLAITIENIDKIDIINLQAIERAIDEDRVPKEQPSK